jgi:hypothetical protein
MENIIEKIKSIKDELVEAHGPFRLFGLFLREDSVGNWDLVVSSDWACDNRNRAIREISDLVSKKLDIDDLTKLSSVFVVEKNIPLIQSLGLVAGEMKDAHLVDCKLNGVDIKDAYIITYNYGI